MKIGENIYNFDRVVKLTLFYAKPNGRDKQGKQKYSIENFVVIEHDPLSDWTNPNTQKKEKKNSAIARIDFETTDIGPQNRNQKAGFTANIRLYNITDDISQAIAHKGNFGPDLQKIEGAKQRNEAWFNYQNSRLQCKLEVGYSDGNGGSETHTIFQGYVNSSFSYRKGQDQVTELMCFNRDDTSQDYPIMCIIDNISEYSEVDVKKQLLDSLKASTWEQMFKNIVMMKSMTRPATATIGGKPENGQVSNFSVAMNDLERLPGNFDGWFKIEYIKNPDSMAKSESLRSKLQNFNIEGFSTQKRDMDSALNDLCAFKNLNLTWKMAIDTNGVDSRWAFYVWETGNGKKIGNGDNATIKIVNYHTLVDAPTVNGNGNMTIKMMLYPQAKPLQTVGLLIKDVGQSDGDYANTYEVVNAAKFSETQQSVAGGLSSGNYAPLVQGPYAIQVFHQDKTSKGYMFNKSFPIIKVVHKGSTHSKEWYTTLTTVPMAMGLTPGD